MCIVEAKVIGVMRMLDGGEHDDKIIAVMKDDSTYGHYKDISEAPEKLIETLKHYFLTYKEIPSGHSNPIVEIPEVYGRVEAIRVINAGHKEYINNFT